MKEKYTKQLNETKSFLEELPWENKDFYADFLAQTYYFVCHSTRLLARSISFFGVDRDHLYKRFVCHIKEENYHEKLAYNDLKNLDLNIDAFAENSFTKAFWETQFYKIDNSGGVSLLGYILFLEAIAVHCYANIFKIISTNYGDKATSFVRVHVQEDPEHVSHALDLIDSLRPWEQKLIWQNFEQTSDIYRAILLKILKDRKGIKEF